MYESITGPLIQAIRITDSKKKKFAIDFLVDLIKNDKKIEDFFWEEYKQLSTYVASFIWANVPELFED
ncbi:MAG: hypothetical protein WA055_03410 [Candidatus Moraniibacteriota bacterium]